MSNSVNNQFILSIVIVTLNSQEYIEKAINSVINQTNNSWELIVLDGNSSDNTVKIIGKFKKYISYFISEKDLSIYDAMNKGIKASNGTYISFLNSDDAYMPRFVENVKNAQNELKIPFFISPVNLVNKENKQIGIYYPINNHSKDYLFSCSPFPHLGMAINLNILRKLGGFDLSFKYCSDYELMIRLINKFGYGYQCIPFISANYTIGGRSSKFEASLEACLLILKKGNIFLAIKYMFRNLLVRISHKLLARRIYILVRKKFGRNSNYKI